MIPIRLEVKNFLPFRTPDPVYFEGMHLACLTGHNGAGKSSLLDAITWVLWGKARVNRDDQLIHSGQNEMYVQLDFEQEDAVYRVIRRRERRKRSIGSLDLLLVQADGGLTTLNEGSMRETQARIDRLLRLDYDTFVHSAFLQQGKADAFTTQNPARRKDILADILGLEQWRVYEDRAKQRLKELNERLATANAIIAEIDRDLAKEPQLKHDLAAAETRLAEVDTALQAAIALQEEVAHAPTDLQNRRTEQDSVARRLRQAQDDARATAEEIERRKETIVAYEAVIAQEDTIEAGYATLTQARQDDARLGEMLSQLHRLDKRAHELQAQIDAARSQLEQEAAGHRATLTEAERVLAADEDGALDDVVQQIVALEALEKERDALQKTVKGLAEANSARVANQKTLQAEGQKLNERIEKLAAVEEAACPLCGQPLTPDHRGDILAELTAERDAKRDEWRQLSEAMKAATAEIQQHEQRISEMGDQIAGLGALRSREGALRKQQQDRADAQARFDSARQSLDAVEAALANDDYAGEWRIQLAQVQAEREAIGYDEDRHQSTRSQLNDYQTFDEQYRRLDQARFALPGEQTALERAEERAGRLQEAIADEETRLATLAAEITELEAQARLYQERSADVQRKRTEHTNANEAVIICKQELKALDRQRQNKAEKEKLRDEAEAEKHIYTDLRAAFGKNGVPAMIIDAAIPELEIAANDLLARMTGGRMHLRLTTQRANQDGSVRETLDIQIADELGERDYELYSGGEAFRINFALRVALSKLLARRAGAHLRTLFIDEGFGTQDDDGRNKLVEAITAIQDDFDLILVITHIEDLRDAFPVHIVVDKTGGGSRVSVR